MTERYAVEYNSQRGFVIVDTTGPVELCTASREMAERVTEALNVAVARGLLRSQLRSNNTSPASGLLREGGVV